MNKQKINAYLEESLKPWTRTSSVIKARWSAHMPALIIATVYANEYIKYLIKDKS